MSKICTEILASVDNIDAVRALNKMSQRMCKAVKECDGFNGSPDAFGAGCALYLYDRYGVRFLNDMLDDDNEFVGLVKDCVRLYNASEEHPEVAKLREIIEFIDEHGELFGEYLKDDEETGTQNNLNDVNKGLFVDDIGLMYKIAIHDLKYHNFDEIQETALASYANGIVDLYIEANKPKSDAADPGDIIDLLEQMWTRTNVLVEDMMFRRAFILICKYIQKVIEWESDHEEEDE